jgi:POT family proton-dependent oligopeptide transporter
MLILKNNKLSTLSFGGFCESFSYYGLLAILILYLSKVYLLSDNKSYSLFGIFTIFAFSAPLFGGMLADQLFGYRKAVILGTSLLIVGNILLFLPLFRSLCFGLACILWGTGFFKPNCISFIGTLFEQNNNYYQKAYTIFYVAINIGGMAGPLIFGLTSSSTYHVYGFIVSAICMFLSLIFFLKFFPSEKINKKPLYTFIQEKILPGYLGLDWVIYFLLFCGVVLTSNIFYFHIIYFGSIYTVILIIILISFLVKQISVDRNIIISFAILYFFTMVFFTMTLQIFTSINLFIDRDINRHIGTWNVPTVMFVSLYPMAVIIMAPVMTSLWSQLNFTQKESRVLIKIFFGLLLASCGFGIFTFAALSSNTSHYLSIIFIILGNLCFGAGELCIMPTILAAISRFGPQHLQSTLVGALYLFVAFAGYSSSIVAKLSSNISTNFPIILDKILSITSYSHFFSYISFMGFGISLIFLIIIPWLQPIIGGKSAIFK